MYRGVQSIQIPRKIQPSLLCGGQDFACFLGGLGCLCHFSCLLGQHGERRHTSCCNGCTGRHTDGGNSTDAFCDTSGNTAQLTDGSLRILCGIFHFVQIRCRTLRSVSHFLNIVSGIVGGFFCFFQGIFVLLEGSRLFGQFHSGIVKLLLILVRLGTVFAVCIFYLFVHSPQGLYLHPLLFHRILQNFLLGGKSFHGVGIVVKFCRDCCHVGFQGFQIGVNRLHSGVELLFSTQYQISRYRSYHLLGPLSGAKPPACP